MGKTYHLRVEGFRVALVDEPAKRTDTGAEHREVFARVTDNRNQLDIRGKQRNADHAVGGGFFVTSG